MGKDGIILMITLVKKPLFIYGLILRIILIFTVSSLAVTKWYVPFLNESISTFTLDPWSFWCAKDGDVLAFPYGYVMWIFFLPLTLICKYASVPLFYGYGFTLLVADFSVLSLLRKIIPERERLLLLVYWCSPIVLFATYFLGLNDLIPVFMLLISLCFIKNNNLLFSGIALVAALSAKLSMVLTLPFFLIYLLHNNALRQYLSQFLVGLLCGVVIFLLPFMLSSAGLKMLFSNPEILKVYHLAFNVGETTKIYITPLVYFLILYAVWRIKRLNFDLFYAMLGISLLVVVLMTPASPGWFIWTIPLLVKYQSTSDRTSILLTGLFSIFYILSSLFIILPSLGMVSISELLKNISNTFNGNVISLIHTAMASVGLILVVRIWREAILKNDYFRLSKKPFVIGISGDSGSGKDTFSDALKGLFGAHSVATLSGDDYHLWDRQKPMWQVMTHLNPKANDLEGFSHDLIALADGKAIYAKHYNHATGRMSHPYKIKSNDVVIASGLHALYLPILRECYSLKIYLDINEDLRKYFKLKRDVYQRGHTIEKVMSSFEKREPDSDRFIRPQSSYADIIFSLQPIHPRMLEKAVNDQLRYKLMIRSRHGINENSLIRVLVGICGLHVDMTVHKDSSEIELIIEGENSAEDISLATKLLCPRVFEFLDIQPKWQGGMLGLMQLITLSHINQALTKRFI
jgi:uridine kinase